jgi:hypothetical protein
LLLLLLRASAPASFVSLSSALRTGAAASARHFLERFCEKFTDKHGNDPAFGVCGATLADRSNTYILEHFEHCPAVTHDEHLLLGDAFSMELSKKNLKLPSTGSLAKVYQKLSEIIHSDCIYTNGQQHQLQQLLSHHAPQYALSLSCSLFILRCSCADGKVIVPARMSMREKRFFIRFLIADGEEVMIVEDDGTLRKPYRIGEIETPPTTPPESPPTAAATAVHSGAAAASSSSPQPAQAEANKEEGSASKKRKTVGDEAH